MNHIRLRTILFVLVTALAAILTGCKSESSPTAPPTTTTPGGTTTTPTTPPSGSVITLSFSNNNPIAPANVTVTAAVTLNGQPVPNGTAVQFTTTVGTFVEAASTTTPTTVIRTTTNGIATATVAAQTAGSGTITATVNDVTKSAALTFAAAIVPPKQEPTNPTITGITPTVGIPAGGQIVTITGTNFRQPVRVIVDPGSASGQAPKDAFVNSVTPTQIVAVLPPFNVATGTTLPVSITVVDESGTANQQSVTAANAFTYASTVLTPSIRTLDPTSGPIDGGTRVAILGDSFQAPVQVFFGSASAQVIRVTFNEIDVVSPTGRDTSPDGSLVVTGPIDVKVTNVASGKSATSPQQFRYVNKAVITAISPGVGTAFGGTRVTIDGSGFDAPVTVSLGGIVASPISVTPTQIIAITGRTPIPCSPPTGPTTVSNVDNGDAATGPSFVYSPEKPIITNVQPLAAQPSQSVQVTVAKPGVGIDGTAFVRFVWTIAGQAYSVFPNPSFISDPAGPITFSMVIPTPPPTAFPVVPCTVNGAAGTQMGPLTASVQFVNVTTSCTDTYPNFQLNPAGNNPCVPTATPPIASINPLTFCPNGFGVTTASGTTNPMNLNVSNTASGTGASPLNVTNVTITGTDSSQFTVSPTTLTVNPGQTLPLTVTFAPTSSGTKNATLTVFTNDPNKQTITVCLQGTAP